MLTRALSGMVHDHPIMFWTCIGLVLIGLCGLALQEFVQATGRRYEGVFETVSDPDKFEKALKRR